MAAVLTITPEDQTRLRQLARSTKDAKTAIRIRVILALGNGHSVRHVAELFLLDEDTVAKWRNRYRKRRTATDWLATTHKGGSNKLSRGQCRELEARVAAETITDAKVVVAFIKDHYGQGYTLNGVAKLLQ